MEQKIHEALQPPDCRRHERGGPHEQIGCFEVRCARAVRSASCVSDGQRGARAEGAPRARTSSFDESLGQAQALLPAGHVQRREARRLGSARIHVGAAVEEQRDHAELPLVVRRDHLDAESVARVVQECEAAQQVLARVAGVLAQLCVDRFTRG